MAGTHWTAPDVAGDILAEAVRPDAAPPIAVHVRPELHELIVAGWNGIPLVVDDSIPATPGYEIHRAVTPVRGRPRRTVDPEVPMVSAEALLAA